MNCRSFVKPVFALCCSIAIIVSATPASADRKPASKTAGSSKTAGVAQTHGSEKTEIVLDTVVASVNEKPITLQEVIKNLHPPRALTFREASLDPEARQVLDGLITEHLILEDAEAKKVSVSDDEMSRYLDEVAQRNGLSRDGFLKALADEGHNVDEYKKHIKVEILKSKLASSYVRNGVGITEEDIQQYIDEHPELSRSGSKVKLSQILVTTEGRSDEDAQARINEVAEKLKSGESFASLAETYSDGAEGKEGGALGVIPERDLGPEIFDAILSLKPGETSGIVKTGAGYHVFRLDDRLTEGEEHPEALKDEARRALQQQKVEDKMQNYFTTELYKLYNVDKKI